MQLGKTAAGKPPAKHAVQICKVEILDGEGASQVPPKFEFWVTTLSIPPQVLSTHASLNEALLEIDARGYSLLGGVPSP